MNRFQVPCPVGLEPRGETAIPTGCQRPAYPHHGSRAFAAVARVVLYCADKEPGHFVFGQEKNNLESNVPFALGYHFTKLRSATTRRGAKSSRRVDWCGTDQNRFGRTHRPDKESGDDREERRRRSCGCDDVLRSSRTASQYPASRSSRRQSTTGSRRAPFEGS